MHEVKDRRMDGLMDGWLEQRKREKKEETFHNKEGRRG